MLVNDDTAEVGSILQEEVYQTLAESQGSLVLTIRVLDLLRDASLSPKTEEILMEA